jgi:sortase A
VPFTTSWPLWPVPDPDARRQKPTERLITLLTCSELFHTNNRSVVIGELVKTYDKKQGTTATNG